MAEFQRYNSTPDDVARLRAICAEWVVSDRFWTFDQVLEFLHGSKGLIHYLREPDGRWSAVTLATVAADSADLCYFYVPLAFRGRGVGKQVLQSLIEELFGRSNVCKIVLEVKPQNTYAIQIYRALGFIESGIRHKYYRDGSDAMVMICQKPN